MTSSLKDVQKRAAAAARAREDRQRPDDSTVRVDVKAYVLGNRATRASGSIRTEAQNRILQFHSTIVTFDPHGPPVLARHAGDVRDGNLFRANRLALALVRAAPEAFGVGLLDHRHDAAFAFGMPLRQERKVRELRADEEVRRRV